MYITDNTDWNFYISFIVISPNFDDFGFQVIKKKQLKPKFCLRKYNYWVKNEYTHSETLSRELPLQSFMGL